LRAKATPKQFLQIFLFINLLFSFLYLFKPHILEGQLGKQVSVMELAKGFQTGDYQGLFPNKHYFSVFREGVIKWAEEFPLYSGLIGFLSKLAPPLMINIARLISFLFFGVMLYTSWLWGKDLTKSSINALLFPLSFTLLPVFKIYSIAAMPDMAMTSCCFIGIYFAYCEKWGKSFAILGLACLFKYFAFFTLLAVFIYSLIQNKSEKLSKNLKHLIFAILAGLPTLIFLLYVLLNKIPNPITEYISIDGHGHLGTIEYLLNPRFYRRLFTWIFLKNAGVLGSLVALLGIYVMGKKEDILKFKILIPIMAISYLVFALTFAHGHYIHDYYTLQFSLISTILIFFSLNFFLEKLELRFPILLLMMTLLAILKTFSTLAEENYYLGVGNAINKYTKKSEQGFLASQRMGEAALFIADRTAWLVKTDDWYHLQSIRKRLGKLLVQDKVDWVGVLLVGKDNPTHIRFIEDLFINHYGWTKKVHQGEYGNNPKGYLWLFRRPKTNSN